MDWTSWVAAVEGSDLAEWLRSEVRALPVVNALHVMGVGLLFGTILVVDLRLLGLAGRARSFRLTARELLPLTWAGFAVALATGAMMFAANAATYVGNTAFLAKMGLLLLAGLNMAVFELATARGAETWDTGRVPPAGRLAGGLSVLLWLSVIFFGRWIGFTKGYDFQVPEGVELDFDFSAALVATLPALA
jgi:hypothetical protein